MPTAGPRTETVWILGANFKVPKGTKADMARYLFTEHPQQPSVTEVSKALDMAYSQAHSIYKKLVPEGKVRASAAAQRGSKAKPNREDSLIRAHGMQPREADRRLGRQTLEDHAKSIPTARQKDKARKGVASPIKSRRVGKLRAGSLPSDIGAGECANCAHDIVVRRTPTGFILVHVNVTAEEHLAVTQFCQAVPELLIPL